MNYLQLCQQTRQECGGAGVGPASVVSQSGESKLYTDWVRQAWLDIQLSQDNWSFLWGQSTLPIIAGTREYLLSSTISSIDGGTVKLDGAFIPEIDYKQITTDVGKPTAFTFLPNGLLALNTIPDANYTLSFDYFGTPVELVANTDTPAIAANLHMIIVYKAMMLYGAYENAPEVYAEAMRKYGELYSHLTHRYLPAIKIAGTLA